MEVPLVLESQPLYACLILKDDLCFHYRGKNPLPNVNYVLQENLF